MNIEETMVNLRLSNGLSGETVYRVISDYGGHIWIATSNGVSAYNGKYISQFSLSDARHPTVVVNDICELNNHTIFAAAETGLFQLRIGEKQFQRILPEVSSPTALLAVGDTLYIGGRQGLQMYDGCQLKTFNVGASNQGLDNIVRSFVLDDNGQILFLGRYGVFAFNPKTEEISQVVKREELPDKTATTQFAKYHRRLFIGTQFAGLLVFDLDTRQVTHINGIGNVVRTVSLSSDGYICVATDGAGAFTLDPKTLEIVETFNTSDKSTCQLPTNALYSFYRSKEGINWFGFVRYGLSYTYHVGKMFQPYSSDDFDTSGMNVRSFCFHGSEAVIGLQNGFWYVDTLRHVNRYFSSADLGGGHIVNSIAWMDGEFYIGTYDGGVRVLEPKSMTLRKLLSTRMLDFTTIGDVKTGPDGRLWIGSGEGLFIIDKDGNISRYTEQNSHIVGGLIISITFDKKGNAWLTGASGISVYSAESQEIIMPNFPDGFFDKQPFMRGAAGHDGLIFMRTGPQLFYTTEGMRDYGEIKIPLKLTDKWCRSFVDDMKGNYWLASERGLFRFDYQMQGMIRFGQGAGLGGDFINDMATDADRLWVATSQGLFYLDLNGDKYPWEETQSERKVALYDVIQGNQVLNNTEIFNMNESHQISLWWNFGSETFKAKALLVDYAKQTGRFYEYKEDNDDWQLLQDGELISLSHLWLGNHRLSVRLAGIGSTVSSYDIAVLPSFTFIIECVFLIITLTLLFLWYRYRKNTKALLSERNEIEEALMESEELRAKSEEELAVTLEEPQQKYQKVKIDEQECADIVKRMKDYIERERVYTNAELKMKELADVLHLSAPKLSQVFNLYLKENYYEFINRYRLEEFKRLVEAGELKRYTITALSERCGFKKSNFFSTFRKVEGMTPAEYLKKQGIKV